jgi:hypothetical protein
LEAEDVTTGDEDASTVATELAWTHGVDAAALETTALETTALDAEEPAAGVEVTTADVTLATLETEAVAVAETAV